MRIVVVGGGIAGLAAAHRAHERFPHAEVVVLEAAAVVGGKLQVAEIAGHRVDIGAEALLARRPEGLELIDRLGLSDELIAPSTTAAAVFAGGARHPLPTRTMLGIPGDLAAARSSGVLGEHSLAGLVAEPTSAPIPPLGEDVSVGALVRSRLGDEVVDRLVEPLLGGVYAGHADRLSLRATMPGLASRLATGGSLVEAARAVTAAGSTATGPVFASLVGGLGRLPERLAGSGGFRVQTSTTVRSLLRTPTGFVLECGPVPDAELVAADAVIIAVPAAKAARLLRLVAPAAAVELAGIEMASVAITTLAFRDLALPAGSGLLVGAREGLAVKAVTLSSQKWPLVTGGLTLLRASLGRAGEAQLLQREDADLEAIVRHDLRRLYGVDAAPVDSLVTRWGGGLPQYAVGHVARVARIRSAIAGVPALGVCGASYDGLGIPACIASAWSAVDVVAPALSAVVERGQ